MARSPSDEPVLVRATRIFEAVTPGDTARGSRPCRSPGTLLARSTSEVAHPRSEAYFSSEQSAGYPARDPEVWVVRFRVP